MASETDLFEELVKAHLPAEQIQKQEDNPEEAQPDEKEVVTSEAASQPESEKEINWEAILSEKTNGKFKSFDEINNFKPSFEPEFANDISRSLYENILSGNSEKVAELIYEQSVLDKAVKGEMDAADVIKLRIAYENPEFSDEDIDEEFNSRYGLEEPDELATDEEIAKFKREQKRIERELKKEVKAAQQTLSQRMGELKLPEIQKGEADVDIDSLLEKRMNELDSNQRLEAEKERLKYSSAIDPALKALNGFEVNFKDGDVEFDGKFNITDEEKAVLRNKAESFTLEDFYGNRYYKDGNYDVKTLMEDIYFLENKDKIIKSLVSQAVNNAKLGIVKNIKNVDLEQPRSVANPSSKDIMDKVANVFFGS